MVLLVSVSGFDWLFGSLLFMYLMVMFWLLVWELNIIILGLEYVYLWEGLGYLMLLVCEMLESNYCKVGVGWILFLSCSDGWKKCIFIFIFCFMKYSFSSVVFSV